MRLSSGAKFSGFLMPRDLMTRGTAVVGNQALAVRDLLRSRSFEMDVGEQIGIGFGQQESGEASRLEDR